MIVLKMTWRRCWLWCRENISTAFVFGSAFVWLTVQFVQAQELRGRVDSLEIKHVTDHDMLIEIRTDVKYMRSNQEQLGNAINRLTDVLLKK